MIDSLIKEFADKRIAILGFGREGLSTYRLFRKYYPNTPVIIADHSPVALPDDGNITAFFGEDYINACASCDMIIKSPGIPLIDVPNGMLPKITSQTHLFLKHFSAQTVGVTGTKGKSTTSSLIYHILSASGRNALLVGNIGSPVFDSLDLIGADTSVVYELSCHQLELCTYSPKYAILLNLYEEHLDHYGTAEKYYAAKKNIFLHQKDGILIYDKDNRNISEAELCKSHAEKIAYSISDSTADLFSADGCIIFRGHSFKPDLSEIKLRGRHNFGNIGVAYAITTLLGVSDEEFGHAVSSFNGLHHRLEFIGNYGGVDYYDDSISTIPATAIAAMESIGNVGSIMLGGMERGIDLTPLCTYLREHTPSAVILMPDTGKRLYGMLSESGLASVCHVAESLSDAVILAKKFTPKGTACLFSPAAASYHQFKNFEARGDAFKAYVAEE